MDPHGPLIVQSDLTVLAEVDAPGYEEARDALAGFAELVKMPEHVHTYRLTPLSIWNACAVGISPEQVLATLERHARFPLPPSVPEQIRELGRRFGALRLEHPAPDDPDDRLILSAESTPLAAEIERHRALQTFLSRADGDVATAFRVEPAWRGAVKRALIKLGWPVDDRAGFADGDPLPLRMREETRTGAAFRLRDYQEDAVKRFLASGTGAGAGVICLPCGAGKTLIGMGVMAELQAKTLILVTNVTAARQWREEILDKTTLTSDDVGEFSGARKEIRPVTIATYQSVTHRTRPKSKRATSESADQAGDSRPEPETASNATADSAENDAHAAAPPPKFTHFSLFDAQPWGLILYDEVHLLPAPLFQAAAGVQARRRLGLTATLVREDGMEDDVFALIGPKVFELPWRHLEGQGWIAPAVCTEIRIPMPRSRLLEYATASAREKPRIAAANPDKTAFVRALLERHAGEPTLVIGTYVEHLNELAAELDLPLLDGSTAQRKRDALFGAFRWGEVPVLAVSRIANFSIDLPDASVAIQVSGQFGSRQEEAQRLGRLLRPKGGNRQAHFYTVVTRDTVEQDFALKRQLFLCEQGYEYHLCLPNHPEELPSVPAVAETAAHTASPGSPTGATPAASLTSASAAS